MISRQPKVEKILRGLTPETLVRIVRGAEAAPYESRSVYPQVDLGIWQGAQISLENPIVHRALGLNAGNGYNGAEFLYGLGGSRTRYLMGFEEEAKQHGLQEDVREAIADIVGRERQAFQWTSDREAVEAAILEYFD